MAKPKEFHCPVCGCKRFWRIRTMKLLVDFGQEGALTGHPKLEGPEHQSDSTEFECVQCRYWMPSYVVKKMNKEVI